MTDKDETKQTEERNPHTSMTEDEANAALRVQQETDDLMHNGGLEGNSIVAANEEAVKAEEADRAKRERAAKQ